LSGLSRENRILKQEKVVLRRAPAYLPGRTGFGEPFQVHRRGEGLLTRRAVVLHARDLSQQLLRLEIQVTIEAKLRGRDLTAKIHEIHRRSRETYGSLRIHAQLSALGTRCGRKRVERLMRQARLRAALQGASIAACDDVDGISWSFGAPRHITEAFRQWPSPYIAVFMDLYQHTAPSVLKYHLQYFGVLFL
jgi:hypothetical protein